MSVLIKGMDMPKSCLMCPFYICDEEDWCATYRVNSETLNKDGGRSEYCPLVEVPTPHGKLADIDEFCKDNIEALQVAKELALKKHGYLPDSIEAYERGARAVLENIEYCPAAIEAEE